MPPTNDGKLVKPIEEPRRDAEVAAAAADAPEQLGLGVRVDEAELAIGRHDLRRQQVVDRQTVLADEVADAAAQREAADPDRAGVAEADRQAVRGRRLGHLAGREPGLRPGSAAFRIDLDRLHVAQVDHDAALGHAVAQSAVAAASNGELHAGGPRQRDDVLDVRHVGDADDGRRPAIDPTGHDGSRGVVVGIVGRNDPTADGGAELGIESVAEGDDVMKELLPSRRRGQRRRMVRPFRPSRRQELIGRDTDEFRI